ncbi:MAG: hypothetical protein H7X93_14945 [Sphingomonadaceae bacterium]|nr:hypothetical protein [Sphingomonadaceae bacterium]
MIGKILVGAFLASGAAVAMAQPASPPPSPGTYVPRPSGNTVDNYDAASGPHGVTQQGTVPNGQSSGATSDHPPCSATITDGCLQTYERGREPGQS